MTKTPQHNVPELRFPEFEGEWSTKILKDIMDVRDGTHESPKPQNEGYLLVTSKNLNKNHIDFKGSYYISKDDYEKINERSKVEIGDILFGMIGTIGNPILLTIDGFAIKNVALLKTYHLPEKYFILNYLKTNNTKRQFYKMNAGGTQKFIALGTIRNLKVRIPINSVEAEKIGTFFNKLDRQIELEEKKLELLEQQKKGYMQKIFSQELRFKDENGNEYPEWEEKKLGEETRITMGQSPKSQNYTSDEQNTVLIQGNADLNNGEIYPRIYTTQITKMAEIKDIILSVRAPVGEIAIAQIEACIGRGVCAIKGSKFIYMYLEYLKQINYWKKITQGSTFESISSKDIKDIIFYKPDEKEQAKIANFLSEIDKLIKDQSFKLEYLKQRKRGLLQKMFI